MLKPDTSVNTQPYQKETEFYYKKQIAKYKNYDKSSPEDLNGYLKENEDYTYLKRKGKYCRVSYLNHFQRIDQSLLRNSVTTVTFTFTTSNASPPSPFRGFLLHKT